jgi:hypothetical protein
MKLIKKKMIRVSLLALLALSACTSDPPPATCDTIEAGACINPPASFANQIQPVLDRSCNTTCHTTGSGVWPLTGYDDVSDWASLIQCDLALGTMPPTDAGSRAAITNDERAMILNWIACQTPNN